MRKNLSIMVACIVAAGFAVAAAQTVQTPHVYVSKSGGSYLGVGVADIDAERAKALNLKEENGVEVKAVTPDGPATKAGIKEGDVVLEYNGQAVQGTEQFQRLVRETPAGRQVKLSIWRGGATQNLTATLGTRKGPMIRTDQGEFSFSMPPMPEFRNLPAMPDMPKIEMSWRNAMLGIDGESIGAQLAEYFGVKDGVLVRSVVKNSAAEKAGMKAGDVIVKIDNSNVTTSREITNALRSLKSKKSFPVVVVRNRKEMTLTVTIDEQRGTTARTRRARPERASFIRYC